MEKPYHCRVQWFWYILMIRRHVEFENYDVSTRGFGQVRRGIYVSGCQHTDGKQFRQAWPYGIYPTATYLRENQSA